MPGWILIALALVTFVLWLKYGLDMVLGMRHVPKLAAFPPLEAEQLPSLSIVFAARDEALKIEAATLSLLAMDYPSLEIIAVNDRSSDDTGDILDQLAAKDRRLRVIHVDSLPDGWLGKTNGLQQGFLATSGDYLLFTDADVHFSRDALRRAIHYMQKYDVAHLAVPPKIINAKPSLKIMLPAFAISFFLNMRPWKINTDTGNDATGVGAFNLLRRDALQAINGLEKVRLRPDEDVKLGKAIRAAGFRQRIVDSSGLVQVEWYRTAPEAIQGMEKNSFAFLDYSVTTVLISVILVLLIFIWPPLALLLTPDQGFWFNLGSSLIVFYLHLKAAAKMEIGWYYGLLYPLGMLLMLIAILNSMFRTLQRKGVVWRGTLYPLSELRNNKI